MSYLKFEELKSFGICSYRIINKKGEFLGLIEPEPAWGEYAFKPQSNTLFSISCLIEIVSKMKTLD